MPSHRGIVKTRFSFAIRLLDRCGHMRLWGLPRAANPNMIAMGLFTHGVVHLLLLANSWGHWNLMIHIRQRFDQYVLRRMPPLELG